MFHKLFSDSVPLNFEDHCVVEEAPLPFLVSYRTFHTYSEAGGLE